MDSNGPGNHSSPRRGRFVLVQALTLGRVPLAIAFAALLLTGEEGKPLLTVATVLLALIELTDLLDGILARRLEVVSEWGAMLDPYADSISRIIIYWALACNGLALAIVPLGMAVRDITVAYCRVVMTQHGRTVKSNWAGKAKAWVQGAGAFFLLLGPSVIGPIKSPISWIVLVVTIASAVAYVRAAAEAARQPAKSGDAPQD